jgi:hypothetical protein
MRARSIKPGFYKNEELAECGFPARLLFPGLWMMADREGKLEYRPKRIKGEIFPFDDADVAALIQELEAHGLVKKYSAGGATYLWIVKFMEHQRPHHNEQPSIIPNYINPDEALATKVESAFDQGPNHFALNPSSLTPESQKAEIQERARPFLGEPKAKTKAPAAFEFEIPGGEIVRLSEKGVKDWEEAYRYLDVRAELRCIADKPVSARARWTKEGWYGTLSAWLRTANAKAKDADPLYDPSDPTGEKRSAREDQEQRDYFERNGITPPPRPIYTQDDYLHGRVPGCIGYLGDKAQQPELPEGVPEDVGALVAQLAAAKHAAD